MKKTTLILAVSAVLAACATQEAQKPAANAPAAAPATPAPAPAPVPRATQDIQIGQGTAAKPEPKKPAVINLSSTQLFEFDKATLTSAAKNILDTEVAPKLREFAHLRYINVNGHADRLGSAQYNQRLSERRANSVRAYLVSKGADAGVIETFGFGKTQPVKSCPDQKNRKALIECLAPNRRVVVEIQGTPR
ncbi:MAG TPA: OmpA family protein [Burkholderiales bacterium]|nr:OmpA family protein [Burkholderiales bacterium]